MLTMWYLAIRHHLGGLQAHGHSLGHGGGRAVEC
jgi:hypothetical protein